MPHNDWPSRCKSADIKPETEEGSVAGALQLGDLLCVASQLQVRCPGILKARSSFAAFLIAH